MNWRLIWLSSWILLSVGCVQKPTHPTAKLEIPEKPVSIQSQPTLPASLRWKDGETSLPSDPTPPPVKMPETVFNARRALVIGNGDYRHESRLRNPVNDANDVARQLKALGFEVILEKDADRRTMTDAITDFGKRLGQGDVGLFYYSGHGVQAKGHNYLIPVSANIRSDADLEHEAVDAKRVLNHMDSAKNALNIVILDACRSNPYKGLYKGSGEKGLARIRGIRGTVIAYATQPDNVALDGAGRNSPYTKNLLHFMNQPGMKILEMFNKVGLSVRTDTGEKQDPWISLSAIPEFCFAGC